jgi:carbon storage regulator
MLVLTRRVGEKIVVGGDVVITVKKVSGNRVAIGIEAPAETRILRGELEPFADGFAAEDDADVLDETYVARSMEPTAASGVLRFAS